MRRRIATLRPPSGGVTLTSMRSSALLLLLLFQPTTATTTSNSAVRRRRFLTTADDDSSMNDAPLVQADELSVFTSTSTSVYSTPDAPDWPSFEQWQDELAALLSAEASLLGPYFDNPTAPFEACRRAGTDAYARRAAATGVCMQATNCHQQFCRPDLVGEDPESLQAPAYVLDPRTPQDISVAIQFAGRHRVPVSVKNTGHSYYTGSLARNSLLIWMTNYPTDDTVTLDFQDSCQNQSYNVVGIGGGEVFDDVINALGRDYHVLTGACRSVGFAGWLQGLGLSYTGRQYGLGIDNIVAMQVVLPDGSIEIADACSNPDLFYALRGGGGGTFGIVTHMQFLVQPVTPIIYLQWQIRGLYTRSQFLRHTRVWFDFLLDIAPRLDPRWGGNWDPAGIDLYFTGTLAEAQASFLDEFDIWYDQVYRPTVRPGWFWGIPRPSSIAQEFDSWFDARGGAAAFRNPDITPRQGDGTTSGLDSSRLVTADYLASNKNDLLNLMVEMADQDQFAFYSSYLLGGNMMNVDPSATAVHPVMRQAVLAVHTEDATGGRALRDLIPPEQTGVSYNHHSAVEPEWRQSLWGGQERYETLLAIKDQIDPERVLNCWHCVGYVGDEIDADTLGVENDPPSLCVLYLFTFCIFSWGPWFNALFWWLV